MRKIRMNPFAMFIIGLCTGILARLLDIYTQNLGEVFSQMAVWILFGTLVSIYSNTPKKAATNTLTFCLGMLIMYYIVAALSHGVYDKSFIIGWTAFALCSPVMAYVTWMTKQKGLLPKIISIGIVAVSVLSSVLLFDGFRIYDLLIDGCLVFFCFLSMYKEILPVGVFRKEERATKGRDPMNEYKIMIVDDEPDILDLLEKALNIEGFYNIVKITGGLVAVDTCKKVNPDIIILDVMLPDIDGYEVCKRIRQFSHCPILYLSSKNDEVDKILGLAVGGDDYVTKPFSPKEVAFRVKAQLRRAEYRQSPEHSNAIAIGELVIDPDGCRAAKNGKDMELTAKEFEILQYLAQNIGRVISRERLYETIWREDSYGCDNTIMVHIRHLREKLEDNPTKPQYIITMKGLGYKLVNPYEK